MFKIKFRSFFSSQNVKNSFWSAFEVLVLPLLMILATPFFLKKLGAETYGQWVLINSIIASFGVLNLGLGDATIRFIAKYKTDDPLRTVAVANTTYSFYAIISSSVFILGYVYLSIEETAHLFFGRNDNDFIYLLKLGVALFGIRLIEQIIFSIYKGFERFDIFSKFSISSKTVLILTNVIVVFFDYGLNVVLFSTIITSLFFLSIEFLYLKKFLPGFSIYPEIDKRVFSEIMSYGIWSWIQSIIGILSYQLDKFLVAYLAGLTVLSYYSIGFTIGSQIFNVFVALSNWIFPKVSQNYKDNLALVTLYHNAQLLITTLGTITITLFYLIKGPILLIWLGQSIYDSSLPYVNAYCIYIVFTVSTIVPAFFMMGTGSMRLITANIIFSIVVTVVLMYFLYDLRGSIGLVYGRIISGFISIPLLIIIFNRLVLKQSFNKILFVELSIPIIFTILLLWADTTLLLIAIVLLILMMCFLFKSRITSLFSGKLHSE